LIIGFVAIYAYLRPGAVVMGADQKYSTASKLINIVYLWGLLLIIVGIPLALIIIGFFLLIAGVILSIIRKDRDDNTGIQPVRCRENVLYLVAGVLSIVGLFIELATPVAWILMYIALGESIGRHESQPSIQPPQIAVPPSIS